ncbi:MAG: hypothetical protein CMJ50_00150, partial [Planctomycetaceae bacterium]|nr:hypothetical protein [Planctomycetaceae bacterium]
LSQLEETAESLTNIERGDDIRLVDALCGLRSTAKCYARAAAILLLLKHESCSAIPGHASACQAALYLPEQIFRVWAFWCLGINYYKAPENAEKIWSDAELRWPVERRGTLVRATAGKSFPSLLAFAYFALAKLLRDQPHDVSKSPFPDFPSLERAFSQYERLRSPKAHSYCCTSAKDRKVFFALIDEWLDCLLSVCPETVTRSELLGMIEPLPIVDRQGTLVFE